MWNFKEQKALTVILLYGFLLFIISWGYDVFGKVQEINISTQLYNQNIHTQSLICTFGFFIILILAKIYFECNSEPDYNEPE